MVNTPNLSTTPTSARRVVVVGLDGATFDLIQPWIAQGKLPTLARLLHTSAWAPLESVLHPFTAQAWTSMVTGANQGKHRIFDFWERDFSTYGFRLTNASFRALPALWTLLSQAGRHVIVLNVPMTYPPEKVNGVLVSGWDTPGMGAAFTYPLALKAELSALSGGQPYVIVPDDWKYSTAQRGDMVMAELLREIDVRFAVATSLMAREPWDLTFFVVSALDGAAHFLWKYHDPTHPLYDPAVNAQMFSEDPLLQVYQRADQRLGEFLSTLPPDVHVLVVSDHGEGALEDVEIHLNLWLAQQGLLTLRTPGSRRSPGHALKWLAAKLVDRGKRALYGRVSFSTLSRLRHWWPDKLRVTLGEESFFPGVDWAHTLAYSEEVRGNIWINLKGRDPQGTVAPGTEYEALRDRIITGLQDLRDPRTGKRLVRRVWRREERFSGPFSDRLPDLLVEAEYPDLFRPRGAYTGRDPVRHLAMEEMRHRRITGCHRPNGIFFAHGPAVQPDLSLAPASILDVAPTVLHLLGEPVPSWMDGRVLTEMLTPEALAGQPVQSRPQTPLPAVNPGDGAGVQSYDEAEAQEVTDRLAGLGYL
jgi:predicted AlkP superfamily phosphohydrolase/phosphomutase